MNNLMDLANKMADAYGAGLDASKMSGEMAHEEIVPDHEVELDINLSASIDGHPYKVESKIVFEVELNSVLDSSMGDISSVLEGLNLDLGDDKDAVVEQLGMPRVIGRVKSINTKELVIHNDEGKIKTELNKNGSLLVTITENELQLNCEDVFSYPDNTDALVAIPSMEKMQENIFVNRDNMYELKDFSWTEHDKDNLKISGTVVIRKI